MKKAIIPIMILILVICNVFLLWQNQSYQQQMMILSRITDETTNDHGIDSVNVQGIYTYPGIGAYFVPADENGSPISAPLTLVVFMTSKTTCPYNLSEIETYKRLLPIFQKRNQRILAAVEIPEATAIKTFLDEHDLNIPVREIDPDLEFSIEKMGISPYFMPFKVLYDSTFTAVYMAGANNTPESQAHFESAILRLSDMVVGI